VRGALQIVNQDGAADADLVAQQRRARQLVIERRVMTNVFPGVRLAGVDEVPRNVWMLVGDAVEQRTLC
jgi:hypothetical protein